jgi:hypothetical protein
MHILWNSIFQHVKTVAVMKRTSATVWLHKKLSKIKFYCILGCVSEVNNSNVCCKLQNKHILVLKVPKCEILMS